MMQADSDFLHAKTESKPDVLDIRTLRKRRNRLRGGGNRRDDDNRHCNCRCRSRVAPERGFRPGEDSREQGGRHHRPPTSDEPSARPRAWSRVETKDATGCSVGTGFALAGGTGTGRGGTYAVFVGGPNVGTRPSFSFSQSIAFPPFAMGVSLSSLQWIFLLWFRFLR